MQIGDLVQRWHGNDVGIILWQVGVVDRWMVHWATGEKFALNGHNLFLVTL